MTAHKRPRDDGDESKTRTQLPSHKKRREYSEGDAQLARVYNDLADEIEDTRLQAASALIKQLSSDDSKNADAINAALTRLIKGVNSGRKAARLGFSVALPEVIRLASQTGVLSLLQLLDKIDKLTKVENSASGQEKRDALLGKQFALQALLQAAPSITAESSLWRLPFEHVSDLAKQRPWLRRQCGMSLYQFLDTEPSTEQVQALIDAWSKQTLWRTPEGVALWLKLADVDAVKLPKGIWSHQNPLSSKERLQLAKVMQEVPVDDDDTRTNSGTRQVTPSFAWTAVLDALSKHDKEKNLKEFWDTALTHGLFAGSSSNERKAFGLQIVTLAVSKLDPWALPYLLSKDIVQCIINHRSNTDRYLFEAAQRPLKAILSRCEADPATASGFLKPILQHGGTTFDQLTKTKTTEALLSRANGEALEEVADMVHNLILKPGVDEKKAEHQRRVLADLLVSALRAHRDESDLFGDGDVAPWVAKICHALIDAAYQHETAAEISSPAITSATRTAFQARLMSCIGHLLNYPLAQAVLLPTAVLSELRAGQVSAFAKFRQKDKDALATAEKLLKGLGKKAKKLLGDNAADADGLKLLLSMSMLQVYNQEPDATSALQDLIMSLQSWVDDTSESKTIMTEIIISFTSKPSAAYKKLAEQVFTVLASSMTSDSLQSLLDILQQNESASGQSELFARDDEQEDEDEDEGSQEDDAEDGYLDVEDDSDVEIANGLVTGGEDDSDDSDSASDVSMDDLVGDEEAEFDRKLKEALGTAAMDSDDDGSEMDDDQMLALEPHLATIFKERQKQTSAKQDNKDARENIIMFKNRILDLLNIYVKSQHSSAGAIEVIHPLIELIRTTTNKPTADKAFTVLKTFFDSYSKDKEASINVEDEVLYALLGVLHAEVTEGGSKLHNIACSRSSLFVAKLLVASDINNYKQISKMYNELQVKWYLDPKSKIQGSMFTEWTSWSLSTRHGTKQPAE